MTTPTDPTSNLTQALTGAGGTWAPPRLRADWHRQGYRGDDSIDNLTPQLGRWTVRHHLDDGLPDQVAVISGSAVAELDADLGVPQALPPRGTATLARWSTSTANDASDATSASVAVPTNTLRAGDWLIIGLSVSSVTATFDDPTGHDPLADADALLLGPTADAAGVQTVVYGVQVSEELATDGATLGFSWDTASRYTVVAAAITLAQANNDPVPLKLVASGQTNETGTSTSHTTPTVALEAGPTEGTSTDQFVIVTVWARGSTSSQTWTVDTGAGDTEVIETVGASGSANNVDMAIGLSGVVTTAGSYSRTGTTTSSSQCTMAILAFRPERTLRAPTRLGAHYSPYRTDSPMYGLDRDVAPTTLDVGAVTATGTEYARIFTGQMLDIRAGGGSAKLEATSANRLKLSAPVQPPAAYGLYQGANATWPISYALHACGVYPSPPPQEGCRLWMPFHGSIRSFLPARNFEQIDVMAAVNGLTGLRRTKPIEWVPGPYVLGFKGEDSAERTQLLFDTSAGTIGVQLEDGPLMVSPTGTGKLEFWIRGDATLGALQIFELELEHSNGDEVRLGISFDRIPFVGWNDGSVATVMNGTAIPTDGEWHFVGFAWNIAATERWVNMDGTITYGNVSAITPANFPSDEDWADNKPAIYSRLPIAELQLTAGVNPHTHVGWLRDLEGVTWERTATLYPSVIELASVAERAPREAWELIASYAQAELASLRTAEDDTVEYLGLGHWVQDEQQAVAELISTGVNAGDLDVHQDPTKVRNVVQVNFEEATNIDAHVIVASVRDPLTIGPGTTTLVIPTSIDAVEIRGLTFTNITSSATAEAKNYNSISANLATDGSSTYATSGQVSATVTEWHPGAITVEIVNGSGLTWYLANGNGYPALTVAAKALVREQASVTDSNAASVATRGERLLTVSSTAIQTRTDARRLARDLKLLLRNPRPEVEELELFGQPGRKPGDLVQVDDPYVTQVSGNWRYQSVTHEGDSGGGYTNRVRIRPAAEIAVWGESLWGDGSLWGPSSE